MLKSLFQKILNRDTTPSSPELQDFKQKYPQFFDSNLNINASTPIEPNPAATTVTPQEPIKHLPLLPLRNVVAFPDMIVPVVVGRSESIKAIEKALGETKQVVVLTQRNADKTFLTPAKDLYDVGIIADINQNFRLPDGSVRLILSGTTRVRVDDFLTEDGVVEAAYTIFPDQAEANPLAMEAARRYATQQLSRYFKSMTQVPEELSILMDNLTDVAKYSNLIAAYIPGEMDEKQALLETNTVSRRLSKIGTILEKEYQVNFLSNEIRTKASHKLSQAEREYFLKEQMRVIQDELKENGNGEGEFETMLLKVDTLKLNAAAAKQAKEEINRLKKMPSFSPEAGLIRSYLDLIFDLPWFKKSPEKFDLKAASRILDHDHYGLDKVKERILEYLAVRKLSPDAKGPILCLVGPPGTGKTSLAKSVAAALGRKYIRISLGGVRDEAEVRGHRRTYIGALPGRIIKGMKTAGVVNPLILLDEVDKMDSDLRGDPTAALLEVLDPEQNSEFVDHFLEVPFDLSKVLFITTANFLYSIPEPLIDRLEIIPLYSYTEEEKIEIARHHLLPKIIAEHNLGKQSKPEFTDAMLRAIIRDYTREAGVRNLEKMLAKICRKLVRAIVDAEDKTPELTTTITTKLLHKYLGPPKFQADDKEKSDQIGIATGLAWTEVGGVLLPIEVATMPGKGVLTITGQLGEVMQESAKAALSYIRAREKQFKLPKDFNEKLDLHIHVPEGAVPKDGPSAGIAIATAIISALTKRTVSSEIAMTGEITLRGHVLPIGGLKEKVLAAHRAGIKTVVLPAKNESDIEDIPTNIRSRMQLHLVRNMDEVLSLVLSNPLPIPKKPRIKHKPAAKVST